jgi:hypothetical protein
MPHTHPDAPINLPVEVEAVLWADAYRDRLRPALEARLSADELAALDLAVDQIEQGAFRPTARLALSA